MLGKRRTHDETGAGIGRAPRRQRGHEMIALKSSSGAHVDRASSAQETK